MPRTAETTGALCNYHHKGSVSIVSATMNFPTKTLGAGVVLSLKSVMSASHDVGLSSIQWRAIAMVGQRPTLQRTSVRRRVEPGRTRNVCS